MAEPLPRGQQLLLQRIMAAHCVTEDQANDIMESIGDDMGGLTLVQCLRSINKGLQFFELEIVTMIGDDGERFHALVNKRPCDIAKQAFPQVDHNVRAYIRLVMEALVEGPCVRSTLVNVRGDLKDPLKLDLDGADRCIQTLLEEHWLVQDSKRKGSDNYAKLKLGPRSFLELTHLLTDLGYPRDELPQLVYHR